MKTADQPVAELASVLVRLSRECESPVEHLRAEQLIRSSQQAWPGDESELWLKWLAEGCRCLGLRTRESDLSVDEASRLAEDGAAVVGAWSQDKGPIVLIGRGEIAEGEIDGHASLSRKQLTEQARASQQPRRWLVVEHAERIDAQKNPRLKSRPAARLWRLVKPEWDDIWIILVFAFFAGILSLSTPIAVESLVNTVAFGRGLQPVVVLAAMLFGFLAFAGVMQAMQTYVAEVIQQRLFARVAADLAHRLPRVDPTGLKGSYAPELVNRFLDVVTLQKVVAQLLLDGVSIVLATLVGMTVLAFYHPWLLGFDVLLLGLVVGGLVVLGRGAFRTSIDESKYKYRLTAWLEDLVRCGTAFKHAGGAEFAVDRASLLTASYLSNRQAHFTVLFRQILFVLGLQAVAGTVLLGGGGWLVIQGQLSLGQLVAAELIVSTILGSLAKAGKHLEGFYDLIASIDKLGTLFDLPVERHDGLLALATEGDALPIELKEVGFDGVSGALGSGFTLTVAEGERVALLGPAGSGKTSLCRALYGIGSPKSGRVSIAGIEPSDLRPDVLRESLSLAAEPELFEGTLADNVHLRRREVGASECRQALDAVGMLDDCLAWEDGLDTPVSPNGSPLSGGQQRLLMIARAIATAPRLVVIDGTLDGLADEQLSRAVDALKQGPWTALVATGRRDIAERFERGVELLSNTAMSRGGDA